MELLLQPNCNWTTEVHVDALVRLKLGLAVSDVQLMWVELAALSHVHARVQLGNTCVHDPQPPFDTNIQ